MHRQYYQHTSRSTSAQRSAVGRQLPTGVRRSSPSVLRPQSSSLPTRQPQRSPLARTFVPRPQSSPLSPTVLAVAPIPPRALPSGLPRRVSFPAPGTAASAKRVTLHTLQQLKQDLYAQAAWAARHQPPQQAAAIQRHVDRQARYIAYVINTITVKV